MRYLIVLEPTEAGFAVQVPDLAISTYGESLEAAKQAARHSSGENATSHGRSGQSRPSVIRYRIRQAMTR